MFARSLRSLICLAPLSLLTAAACGDDGGSPPDAGVDIGFNKPTASLKANREVNDEWTEVGPANLACMGTARTDPPTTVEVALTVKVEDFQSGNLVPGASVKVLREGAGEVTGSPFTADGTDATFVATIPVGTTRLRYEMSHDSAMDTLLINQTLTPDNAAQSATIRSVSKTTAQTLPALIGVARTEGTGVLAGAMRDCDNREMSNFIATVSTTKDTVTHAPGADTYYFSDAVGLPVRHRQQASASKNGLFMVIELGATPTAYVQVWGYKTDADLAADNLELIGQFQTQVIANTVITGSYEPLRTGD